jgi:uncharacterized protein (DUF1800 family)
MNSENKIKHLHWRAAFGLSPTEWQARRSWTVSQAVDNLFDGAAATALVEPALDGDYRPEKMSGKERAEKQKEQRQFVAELGREWIERMASPKSSSLLEKMSFFWHGHFACTSSHGLLAVRQLNLLRTHALGNFRDMVRAIARDPALIRFLNNQQNKKRTPNENFAREVMELFTIGRGNYTETDVKQAARAFTGWSSNLTGEFVFRQRQHDFAEKAFMGQTGNFDGDDIIDIILEREETANFICPKIYAYFVKTEVDESHVGELATTFRKTDYDIAAVMRQLFTNDWFYAPKNVANRIKSPVELLAGMMRQLEVTGLQTKGVVAIQRVLGQLLFHPPNVAGWPGG